ncbi:MAG: LysR family transcriptional regulator [Castellaniella sp.]|uniref:LysR family transcriptional regulator n=1 Tax=Castellaniella sp. TaxID=1955812 RepID=UPI0011F680C1|nr:LysR family transcriptional regulator [Castellaniella sp.]TAN27116.1 MAG: LysR family transcriptional regulator [Castellaniella sp.]
MASSWIDRIRLRNLNFLVSLAQTHNLSHSAKLLHTTQPALSKWLKDLESDIGLTLFDRRARGLVPTSHGEVLIAHARRIQAQLDRTVEDMGVLSQGGVGRVALGASGATAVGIAPHAILLMAEGLPDVRVDFIESTMNRLLELLLQGDLDIVMGRTIQDSDATVGLRSEILYTEPVNLVVRKGHPLLDLETVSWDDIERYRLVIWPQQTPIRQVLESALVAAGRTLKPNYIESNSVIANVTMLNHSDFIGMASHRAATVLANFDLLRVVPMTLRGYGSVSVYWRSDELQPKSVEQTLACIRQVAAAGDG